MGLGKINKTEETLSTFPLRFFIISKLRFQPKSLVPFPLRCWIIRCGNTMYQIQQPGDVVLFSPLTAHCVLTEPGLAASMTTTLKVE